MASWILHLRVAENILRFDPTLISASFAVGNIAPDSGLPDAKWEQFDPPTEVTHFMQDGSRWRCNDIGFLRSYLLPLRGSPEAGLVSFRLGYFFHLLLDNLWDVKFNIPLRERWAAELAADRDFIWEIKKELYDLDFLHVCEHPEGLFWSVFLESEAENGGLAFLPLEAVRQRVAYIQQYYQRTDEEVQKAYNHSYTYLTQAEMDGFVAEASEQLVRIYQQVWLDGAPLDGVVSALDL